MIVRALSLLLLWQLFLVVSSGCMTLPEREAPWSGERFSSPEAWMARGKQKSETGDLAGALRDLRIAQTLAPGTHEIQAEIERIKSHAKTLAKRYLAQAREAMGKGRTSRARRNYLRVLALRPGQPDALQGLRRLERINAERAMARKVSNSKRHAQEAYAKLEVTENGSEAATYVRQSERRSPLIARSVNRAAEERQVLERRIEQNPADHAARRLLIQREMEKAERAFSRERYEWALKSLKKGMALSLGDRQLAQPVLDSRQKFGKSLYSMGLRSYRQNLALALRYWRFALRFDPGNEKTRLRLISAEAR